MKLNKKGISIIELIISVALISVVMLFMYRLLADVSFEKDNDLYATLNQEQRVTMISEIEKTIRANSQIKSIVLGTGTNANKLFFKNGSGTTLYMLVVESSNTQLTLYSSYSETKEDILDRWKIQGAKIYNPTCIYDEKLSEIILVKCIFPIYTTSLSNSKYTASFKDINGTTQSVTVDNNNTIDDIILSFMLYK